MNKLWLTQQHFLILQEILIDCPYEVLLFGSRVTGKQQAFSDLDICLKDKQEIPLSYISQLKTKFNESNFPFLVDIIDYQTVSSAFKEIVDKTSVPFSQCKPAL